jgi:uncharacterized protein DUF2630
MEASGGVACATQAVIILRVGVRMGSGLRVAAAREFRAAVRYWIGDDEELIRQRVNVEGRAMEQRDSDRPIRKHIARLVDEEHLLYGKAELADNERHRLQEIQVELDQCWDLLRQRRALREFGDDPDKARVRPKEVVEGYEQ